MHPARASCAGGIGTLTAKPRLLVGWSVAATEGGVRGVAAVYLDVIGSLFGIRILRDPISGSLYWKARGQPGIHRLWPWRRR